MEHSHPEGCEYETGDSGVVMGKVPAMLDALLVVVLALPVDVAARNAERDVQLRPFLDEIGFDRSKAAAAEELVRVAPPVACEPIRGELPIRCGVRLPTSDPALCWNGAIVAAVNHRHLQMETGDPEDAALQFACGADLVSGRMTARRRPDGRLTTTIRLERLSDNKTATGTLAWQAVTLPEGNPVLHERRIDRLRRPVELARAEHLAALQRGGAGGVIDPTPLLCAQARKPLLAEKSFAGDDTWQKGVLAWLDAIEADHKSGPTFELGRRLALSRAAQEALERAAVAGPVTNATPLSALPMAALVTRVHTAARERDAALAVALQRFRVAHPFTPAP